MNETPQCNICDIENAKHISRATWVCPVCGKDISLEYLFWFEACNPDWNKENKNERTDS